MTDTLRDPILEKKIKASCKRTPENAEYCVPAKHDWYFEIDFSLGLADAHFLLYFYDTWICIYKILEFSSCRIKCKRLSRKFIELCHFYNEKKRA